MCFKFLKMKTDNRRIFISDLPETVDQEELQSAFSQFGQINSIEIKQRKELGPRNKSLLFAYINLETDDASLNQCFRNFSNTKWHGEYVQLQLARESFLDRLKRERQEQENKSKSTDLQKIQTPESTLETISFQKKVNEKQATNKQLNGTDTIKTVQTHKKYQSSGGSSSSDSSASEGEPENLNETLNKSVTQNGKKSPELENESDIVIKSNKNKIATTGILKIPSVGNSPIITITTTKGRRPQNDNASNVKRLQSLQEMKKGYAAQKNLIKNALTYGNFKPHNKIVFADDSGEITNDHDKRGLFDDADEESDMENNFEDKTQFQGKSGLKLAKLQSKFANDKRFALDERFIEDEDRIPDEGDIEEEKQEQFKILEQVLGKRVTSRQDIKTDEKSRKTMLKFDPTQPDHSNLEIKVKEPEKKKRKKDKDKEEEKDSQPGPEVSKNVFYKVSDNLKETFAEKPQFSLLNMFGRSEENEDNNKSNDIEPCENIKRTYSMGNQNPFKYDSSDEEDEIGDIPHQDNDAKTTKNSPAHKTRSTQAVFWTEPFFFKNDDFRLQEGLEFLEKIKSENKEFMKIRRELKGIVRAKVRNNERKNKMFKKKLGGNKRKKHIRMKKALKR